MNTFKSGCSIAGSLVLLAVLSPQATAMPVVISDFYTINPLAGRSAYGDFSWTGDVIREPGGHQTVGGSSGLTATHAGGGLKVAALDLGENTQLALTASRIDENNSGVFRLILGSAGGLSSYFDFSPSLFPSQSSSDTDSTENFGTVTLNLADGIQSGVNGPANFAAITYFILKGDGSPKDFQARFDHLAAIPKASPPNVVLVVPDVSVPDTGSNLVLLGSAFAGALAYRRKVAA